MYNLYRRSAVDLRNSLPGCAKLVESFSNLRGFRCNGTTNLGRLGAGTLVLVVAESLWLPGGSHPATADPCGAFQRLAVYARDRRVR